MSQKLYTVVCVFYNTDGIVEKDLYEVLKDLRINDISDYMKVVYDHVYSGQAVQYKIKLVYRDILINEETSKFYSKIEPYFLGYTAYLDLKEVDRMNRMTIEARLTMSDFDFNYIFGGKNEK